MNDFASLPPAVRFALIIGELCKAIGQRGSVLGRLAGPLLVLIWNRLSRTVARFTHAATTTPPSRPAAKRPPRARPHTPNVLPRGKAWLLRLIPETGSGAMHLRHFLNQPDITALLAANPRLGRILRPLCHALGIRPSWVPHLYAPKPAAAPPPAASAACPTQPQAREQATFAAIPTVALLPQATPPLLTPAKILA